MKKISNDLAELIHLLIHPWIPFYKCNFMARRVWYEFQLIAIDCRLIRFWLGLHYRDFNNLSKPPPPPQPHYRANEPPPLRDTRPLRLVKEIALQMLIILFGIIIILLWAESRSNRGPVPRAALLIEVWACATCILLFLFPHELDIRTDTHTTQSPCASAKI